jgi:DNA primase
LAYRIPEEIISDIKNSVDIFDVVSDVVRLKKTGQNHIGLCPFHSEKTPSFTVNQGKQIFHCFGCGEGGDVFGFIMKTDNLSYPEAIRALAGRSNIHIPETETGGNRVDGKSERERLYELNQIAMGFYEKCLKNPGKGTPAGLYLTRRGMDSKTNAAFRLGYAPAGWTNLLNYLRNKFPPEFIEKSGLIIARDGGSKTYDRFRNRIIFPIFDINSRVIGFGGRAVDDATPKYLNSPETPTYNKRRSLYGLNIARQHCRDTNTVFIVEGYFDCITLHQFGLENTVATLGTALTIEQIRILKGYAEKVILVYDSDAAGIKAAVRSVGLFMQQDVKARILVLPDGHDPDSCIRSTGLDKFNKMASAAGDIIGFLTDTAVKTHGMTPEGKVHIVNDMMEPLNAIEDPVARSLYVKELSEHVMIEETAILKKLSTFHTETARNVRKPFLNEKLPEATPDSDEGENRIERRIIAMMLQFPEIISEVETHNILERFENGVLKSLGMLILECKEADIFSIPDILRRIDDDQMKRIVSGLSINNDVWDKKGCMRLIQQFNATYRKERDKNLIHRIKAAENENNEDLLYRLLAEKQKNAVDRRKYKTSKQKDVSL